MVQQTTSNDIVDFDAIKKNSSIRILLPKANIDVMPSDSFTIFHRQINKGMIPNILADPFL